MNRLSLSAWALLWILLSLSVSSLFASEVEEVEAGEEASDSARTPAAAVPVVPAAAQAADQPMPNPLGALWARFAPRQILAGPQAGVSTTRFRTSPEYGALLKPTPVERKAGMSPSFGAVITARWASGISLTVAPRREIHGLATQERDVSFPDNPFPHTLESRTELEYNVWPVLLGMGWTNGRHRAQAQAGAYTAFLDHADMEWRVDGEAYPNRPQVEILQEYNGWMLGIEYGVRLGPGELVLGLESQRASRSIMEGLKGSVRTESAQMRAAYLWTLMRR